MHLRCWASLVSVWHLCQEDDSALDFTVWEEGSYCAAKIMCLCLFKGAASCLTIVYQAGLLEEGEVDEVIAKEFNPVRWDWWCLAKPRVRNHIYIHLRSWQIGQEWVRHCLRQQTSKVKILRVMRYEGPALYTACWPPQEAGSVLLIVIVAVYYDARYLSCQGHFYLLRKPFLFAQEKVSTRLSPTGISPHFLSQSSCSYSGGKLVRAWLTCS